jgi:hypothetical protein
VQIMQRSAANIAASTQSLASNVGKVVGAAKEQNQSDAFLYNQAKSARTALVNCMELMAKYDPAAAEAIRSKGATSAAELIPQAPRTSKDRAALAAYTDGTTRNLNGIWTQLAAADSNVIPTEELAQAVGIPGLTEDTRNAIRKAMAENKSSARTGEINRMAEQSMQSRGEAQPVAPVETEGPMRPGESRMVQQPQQGVMAQRGYQPTMLVPGTGAQTTSQMMGSQQFQKPVQGATVTPEEVQGTRAYQALAGREAEQRTAAAQGLRERGVAVREAGLKQQAYDKKAERDARANRFNKALAASGVKDAEAKFGELNKLLASARDDSYKADIELDKRQKELSPDLDPTDKQSVTAQITSANERSVSADAIVENLGKIADWIADDPVANRNLTKGEISLLISLAQARGNAGETIDPKAEAIQAGYIPQPRPGEAGTSGTQPKGVGALGLIPPPTR